MSVWVRARVRVRARLRVRVRVRARLRVRVRGRARLRVRVRGRARLRPRVTVVHRVAHEAAREEQVGQRVAPDVDSVVDDDRHVLAAGQG